MRDLNEKVKIIEPSKEIFEIIRYYKKLVKAVLPKSKVTLIGSFAIPMCGKEEFDLLVEVKTDIKEVQGKVSKEGDGRFGIGPINDGEGFCRSKRRYGIICELHIVNPGHKKIKGYLDYVKRLKADPKFVKEFEELKRSLDGLPERVYKEKKLEFLNKYF
ncbi:hypothetical protein CMI47_11385 [Candidatus Pacearchaeota archaeon]|nr:hypothetical protein [Candidatus Pacearchaeota archaeon]|tara:strand:- start:82 stop:561 length:480 start_codon:yes stop_codon:yes gene_type:complete